MKWRLANNDFFEELVLLTPLDYEWFHHSWACETKKRKTQTGKRKIDPETLDEGLIDYRRETDVTKDEDPEIEKKTQLFITNQWYNRVVSFKLLRKLQKNLSHRLTHNTGLVKGYTVYTREQTISDLHLKTFNKSMGGACVSKCILNLDQT